MEPGLGPGDDRRGRLYAARAELRAAIDAGLPLDSAGWIESHRDLKPDLADLLAELNRACPTLIFGPDMVASSDQLADSLFPTVHLVADERGSGPPRPGLMSAPTVAGDNSSSSPPEPPPADEAIVFGRYRVIRVLGRGGFGQVYLARDEELDRLVAIKIPHAHRAANPADLEQFLAEGRTLAKLTHHNIVPVHDVGKTPDGRCYIVSRYVKGTDLSVRLGAWRPSLAEAASLVEAICEAAHHAHIHDLVHRDIKPSNILMDESGCPYLADFGLALRVDNYGQGNGWAGTPAFMSPEQARGEGHRVDGRSDVFSLGVVFYLLLVGRLPFRAETNAGLMHAIATAEPRPPRQVDDAVPKELERVCLKALAKRASERYTTARDMAEDIRHYLAGVADSARVDPRRPGPTHVANPPSGSARTSRLGAGSVDSRRLSPFVPKGLRSFDEHDADIFLELLPGSKDRDGLPSSVRFWLTRVEAVDADNTFRVGMIYGSSGSGKSSFVKAGLLPRLGGHVATAYVESASGGTETRLLRALRRSCPSLGEDLGLVEAMATLRRDRPLGHGRKLLIVLDQFEQWLLTYRGDETSELYSALRQCDGESVQVILLIRDDFWVTATRFMRDLDLELMSDRNMASVELFDPRHARRVLEELGRGYGALPEYPAQPSKDQALFLDEAIQGLARDDKIIPVRLAVFAEMIKSKPWVQSTLRRVGGADGLGATFLEETFGSGQANPRHSLHRDAAQAVLKALLPGSVADIKGELRSEATLREVSGYADRPREFAELIQALVVELRLVSLADPEGIAGPDRPTGPSYQLTHDYLIRSIREWLERRSRATWRGRAGLLLADRASLWDRRRERRQVPSLPELFYLGLGTRGRDRTPVQSAYLRAASRFHAGRSALLAAGLAVVVILGWDWYGRVRAGAAVKQLLMASPIEAPALIDEMAPLRRWIDPMLRAEAERAKGRGGNPPISMSLALLPTDPRQVDTLRDRLLQATPAELLAIRSALSKHRDGLGEGAWDRFRGGLWKDLIGEKLSRDGALRAACGLAEFDPESPNWATVAPEVVDCLLAREPIVAGDWIEMLRPVGGALGPILKDGFLGRRWRDARREVAAAALAEFFGRDAASLVDLAVEASPAELAAFIPALRENPEAVGLLEVASRRGIRPGELLVRGPDPAAQRGASAAAALLGLGHPGRAIEAITAGPDPTMRSYLIDRLCASKIDPSSLLELLRRRDLDPSARQAIILALGVYAPEEFTAAQRTDLVRLLRSLYREDRDPGVHAASGWLLARHRPGESPDPGPPTRDPVAGREWYINGQGLTFAILRDPIDITFGTDTLPAREVPPRARPGRPFALSTTEVTREQFAKVVGDGVQEWGSLSTKSNSPPGLPANYTSYFDAAKFCRRLSEIEHVPEDQMCYPPVDQIGPGMEFPPDHLNRTGYRLPTEAELFAGGFGRSRTFYHFGRDPALIGDYAQASRVEGRVGVVARLMPNDLGLFDTLGNVYEWCEPFLRGSASAADEPVARLTGDAQWVIRGGAYSTNAALLGEVGYRNDNEPGIKDPTVGFRVARTCR